MKPKNITSDMWAPITANKNYTAYVPPKQEAAPETSRQKKQSDNVDAGGSVPKKKAQPKKAPANKARPSQASQSERPISGGREEKRPEKAKKKPVIKSKPAKYKTAKAPSKASLNIAEKRREKTNKAFMKLVRNGKSVDEARAIITKRKLRKRRFSSFLSVMFLFFFAVVFVVTYTYCEGAQVSDIIIDGDEVYTDSEILSAANLSEGVNMLTVREKTVNENVVKALPFISKIGVEYDLPDTLRLNVISTTERFIIKSGSKYICVDKTGKVVSEKKKKLSKGQYLVTGLAEQSYTVGEMFVPSDENREKYDIACDIALAADNNEIINCGTIDMKDIDDITLTYKSRLRVYLGAGNNLSSKMSIAEKVMLDNKAQNKTGYINAKYDIAAYFMQGSMEA